LVHTACRPFPPAEYRLVGIQRPPRPDRRLTRRCSQRLTGAPETLADLPTDLTD